MSKLPVTSAAHLSLVSTYLDALMSRSQTAAREIHPRYGTLWSEIARVSVHGKRLRPLMVLAAYEAFGGTEPSRIIPAAAACELLHISMLVHDDIIDRDMVRHGEPTIQAVYESKYENEVPISDTRKHNALSAALLAGDLLLNEARSQMTKVDAPADILRQAGFAFDQAVFEVAGGELLDVEATNAPRGVIDSNTIMTYKTASYSFVAPLLIGATLAGASLSQQKALRSFAVDLGIAYQLTDDVIGIFGVPDTSGKPNDGDIHEGKTTYLVERFYDNATSAQIAEFESLYGHPETTIDGCERIRDLFRETGAMQHTERRISAYRQRAQVALDRLDVSNDGEQTFSELIELCVERNA